MPTKYNNLFTIKRLWLVLVASMIVMFSILLYFGGEIYHQAPPIPKTVQSEDGTLIYTQEDILQGQKVWLSIGGMQRGSIWGHGSYLAPDWSADWLHREALTLLDILALQQYQSNSEQLSQLQQDVVAVSLKYELKKNTYAPDTGVITISNERKNAIDTVKGHYASIFQTAKTAEASALKEQYAFTKSLALSDDNLHAFTSFVFWTSWSSVTLRPQETVSYTSNFPHDPILWRGAASSVDPSDYAAFMRYALRSSYSANYTLNSLGFRCAKDL